MSSETLKRRKNVKIPTDLLNDIVGVGTRMSNVCYNMAQKDSFLEHERELFRDLYKAWDSIVRKLP